MIWWFIETREVGLYAPRLLACLTNRWFGESEVHSHGGHPLSIAGSHRRWKGATKWPSSCASLHDQ